MSDKSERQIWLENRRVEAEASGDKSRWVFSSDEMLTALDIVAELESALASERAARTAGEAVIAAALAAHKNGPSGFDKAHVGALRVYEILAAAPSAALDAHDAQVAAEAWDEGYDSGSGGEYHGLGSNPYREAAQ